jgi:hypothetical protein
MIFINELGQEVAEEDEGMQPHDEETAFHSARAAEPALDQWALLREELQGDGTTTEHKQRISEVLAGDERREGTRVGGGARSHEQTVAAAAAAAEAEAEARLRSAVNPLAALYGTGEYESLHEVQGAWRSGGPSSSESKPAEDEVDISTELTRIALEGAEEGGGWSIREHDQESESNPTGVQAEDLTALMGPGAASDADGVRRHPNTKRVVSSLWRTVLPALRSGMGANLVMPVPAKVQRRLESAGGKKEGDNSMGDEAEPQDLLKGILDDEGDTKVGNGEGGDGSK